MKSLPQRSAGQALLLVLLSMAVVLTVVLSILSRSVTDITVTSREEEALRAFSAAEAGVERTLITGTNLSVSDLGNQSGFSAAVTGISNSSSNYNAPDEILGGDSVTLWFMDHDANTGQLTCTTGKCFTGSRMKVCWGAAGTPNNSSSTPAAEVSVLYDSTPNPPGDYADVKIARAAIDPYVGRPGPNNFAADSGSCTVGGASYAFSTTVDFTPSGVNIPCYSTAGCLISAKVRMFYNGQTPEPVGFDLFLPGNSLLPSQGKRIISTGTSGEATRKIEVNQTFGELPPIFDSALFSPSGLTK